MLNDVATIDYDKMFNKSKKDIQQERPLMKALKEEQAQELLAEEKKFEALTEDEQNQLILSDAK